MDLRQLTVFVAVADERGFSRAAIRLGLAQSAVSATIRRLEREWGVELFHRSTHRFEVSPEGRALLPLARRALDTAESVNRAADDVRGGVRGTLRIGVEYSATIACGVSVAERVASFSRSHPDVEVALIPGDATAQVEGIRDGTLDLAIAGLPADVAPDLHLTCFAEAALVLACHPDDPLAHRGSAHFSEIRDRVFADLPPGQATRVAADDGFARAGTRRTVAYEVDDRYAALDLVRHGLAIAVTTPSFVPDPAVATVALRPAARPVTLALVGSTQRPEGAAARAFRTRVLDGAAEPAALSNGWRAG